MCSSMRERGRNEPTVTSFWPVPATLRASNTSVAGNAAPRRTFIRLIVIADAPTTTLIVIVIEHARRHRRRVRRECLSSGRDDYDDRMNHPEGRQRKRINAMQAPTGLETIREHVCIVSPLCQLCNLLALCWENWKLVKMIGLDLRSYYRRKV